MSTYIISFDIIDATKKAAFKEKMKSYGTYCPINANCWAIVTDKKATEIRDFLKTGLVNPDRIFVIRSGTEAAWTNAFADANSEWLKKRL